MISFLLKKETVICIIKDNGVGRHHKENKKHKGLSIATQNITERLSILGQLGCYRTKVAIHDTLSKEGIPEGTTIEITLPIVKNPFHEK